MEAAMEAATEGAEWFEVAFEFNYCTVPLRVLFLIYIYKQVWFLICHYKSDMIQHRRPQID